MTYDLTSADVDPAGIDEDLIDPDDDLNDSPTQRSTHRVAAALIAALFAAIAFTGGVLVQKHHDAHTTSSTSLPGLGSGGLPNFSSGGFPTATSNGGGTGTSTASGPAVIGTVVSVHGNDVTVKDLGGKTHLVHISSSTSVSHQSPAAVSSLTPGTTVTVDGATAGDGSVSATTLTTR